MKTKRRFLIRSLLMMGIFLMLTYNCKKDEDQDENQKAPVLTTVDVSSIGPSTAICGGVITDEGGSIITAKGVCWNTNQNPSISDSKTNDGTGTDSFVSTISDLNPETNYYVRAYATNNVGTAYGNERLFTTQSGNGGTVTGIDGNIYHTIYIGTQQWMVENLKVNHYRNGESIPNVTDNTEWLNLTSGACCDYNNTPGNSVTYGKLYNYYAIRDDRNIAPTGWRIPTEDDWTELSEYLGGRLVAGGKLKEMGTIHWTSPNTGASNETGFTALPGGCRISGAFNFTGIYGYWWANETVPTYQIMQFDNSKLDRYPCVENWAFSIRCLKD